MAAVSKVLVIGGGIGGLVAARALRLKSIDVDLIEKQPDWSVYGVGIIQPYNMLRALQKIGLAQQCLEVGAAFDSYRIHDAQGNVLFDPEISDAHGVELPANNGITRPKLHDVLIAGAKEVGTDIRLGTTVSAYKDHGEYVEVGFSDGEQRRYDLALAFDGALSDTRRNLFGDECRPAFNGQGVWRYNFPRPASLDTAALYFGATTKVGLVPLSSTLMYMFIVTPEKDGTWYGGPEVAKQMQERLDGYGGLVGELRGQITDPAAVVYRPMMNLLLPKPWYKGRLLLAGDAAHTTTPHLGQGAAMAIEDGVLLGELLSEHATVRSALDTFMTRRFDRVKYVVDCSTQLASWELEEWRGARNPEARPGELLHEASVTLRQPY